jgi:TM2 domain-containing membrane protein YozV
MEGRPPMTGNGHCPICLLILILLLQPADLCAQAPVTQQPAGPIAIGVLEMDANDVGEGEARAITERLRAYLGRQRVNNQTVFQVIERNKMESIMAELGFQFSGACDTDECVVQVGKILGATKMVAGSVSRVGTLYSLQVRIVDIATSRIETQSFQDVYGIEQVLTTATDGVAQELAAFVAGETEAATPAGPPAGQPAVLTTAGIRFESTPPGAFIVIEGRQVGLTPATVVLTEGMHSVFFRHEGYHEELLNVQVVAGRDRTEMVTLREIPRGSFTLVTDPPGCTVLVDGTDIGQRTPLNRFAVYEGLHRIEIRREGYEPKTREITVRGRDNVALEVTLRAAGSAQLTFRSTLAGATATVIGRERQQTVLEQAEEGLTLPPGEYTVEVTAKGYRPFTRTVNLGNGANEVVPIELQPKSRAVAGLLSVMPGMGQFYSGKTLQGVLFLAGVGATAAMTFGEQGTYDALKGEYDDLQAAYDEATTTAQIDALRGRLDGKYRELTSSRDKLTTSATLMMAVWAVGILEAYTLMPRLRPIGGPDVATDLGLSTRGRRLNLTLTVTFR